MDEELTHAPSATPEQLVQPVIPELIQLRLPNPKTLLEEINLPAELIEAIVGSEVTAEVFPDERLILPDGAVVLVQPIRVFYTDDLGRKWQFPRRWVTPISNEPP